MKTISLYQLRSKWLQKENELIKWRPRRYLHFDVVLDKVSRLVFDKVVNPRFVTQHSFFPFIKRFDKTRLFKKDPETKQKLVKEKLRPIAYAAHFDAVIYSWYSYLIGNNYELLINKVGIGDSVIAYRPLGKSNIQFAKEVIQFIKDKENCVAITSDIKGFYDNLDHKILKQKWAQLFDRKDLAPDHYKVLRSITSYSFVEIDNLKKTLGTERPVLSVGLLGDLRDKGLVKVNPDKKGIPQGAPISCVLSNVYMLDFDQTIHGFIKEKGGMYRRYSDDILLICNPEHIEEAQVMLREAIEKLRLEIEPSKTETFFFNTTPEGLSCKNKEGVDSKLQYLGVTFDGRNPALRHKGYAKFGRKMIRAIDREVRVAKKKNMALAKRKLYEKFTTLGKMNYPKYAKSAARSLDSPLIERSVKPSRLLRKIGKDIQKARDKQG